MNCYIYKNRIYRLKLLQIAKWISWSVFYSLDGCSLFNKIRLWLFVWLFDREANYSDIISDVIITFPIRYDVTRCWICLATEMNSITISLCIVIFHGDAIEISGEIRMEFSTFPRADTKIAARCWLHLLPFDGGIVDYQISHSCPNLLTRAPVKDGLYKLIPQNC